jgi:FKBP-type peptidyl-prolyl cis-trans isomerase (trigger factor)
MRELQKPETIRDGHVVTLGYTLTVDGSVIDTSEGEGNAPVEFIQGTEQIVPGLENALYGMAEGESKNVPDLQSPPGRQRSALFGHRTGSPRGHA